MGIQPQPELLREFVLGTLKAREKRHVRGMLHESPAWQHALERERRTLALIDSLPPVPLPEGLADAALARLDR